MTNAFRAIVLFALSVLIADAGWRYEGARRWFLLLFWLLLTLAGWLFIAKEYVNP